MFGLFGKGKKKKKKTPKKQIKKVSNASKHRKRTNGKVKSTKKEINSVKNQSKPNIEVIPEEIKNNPWNVHYINKDIHANVIIASKNKEALALGTTTEENDKHKKISINDGLIDNQKETTYVKTSAAVISTKRIQKKIPSTRITKRDKDKIYNAIKENPNNVEKYKHLGSLLPEESKKKN